MSEGQKPGAASATRADDGRLQYVFSQSWLNTVARCPEQARAKMSGELVEEQNDSMVLGSAVHAAIETTLDLEMHGYDGDFHEKAVYAIDAYMDAAAPWVRLKFSDERVRDLALRCYDSWYRQVWDRIEPERVEWGFRYQLYEDEQRIIDVAGIIDCIDQDGTVWDWKTTSRSYEPWEYQRWAVQPTIYTWAASQDLPIKDPWSFRYCVMLHDGGVQYLDVSRGFGHVQWVREQALTLALLIESGLPRWPLNDQGWWCHDKWCPKWQDCKGQFMLDGWHSPAKEHGPKEA